MHLRCLQFPMLFAAQGRFADDAWHIATGSAPLLEWRRPSAEAPYAVFGAFMARSTSSASRFK
jgi:hypothetical protein